MMTPPGDLLDAERVKDAVLDRVGHELRTPLTVAMLACELLKTKVKASEEKALAERAQNSVKRLHERGEEILAFASASRVPRVFATDLRELIDGIARECEEPAAERRVRIQAEAGEPLLAACDPSAMKSALKGIVLNAVRFSPRGGRIRVEFEAIPGFAVVRVCDRGPGVPAALRERVFERFFQGENPFTRSAGGLGLGLSTSQAVVHAHGGSLSVLDREGGGTVVRVQLPRRED